MQKRDMMNEAEKNTRRGVSLFRVKGWGFALPCLITVSIAVMVGLSVYIMSNQESSLEQHAIANAKSGTDVEMYVPEQEVATNTYTGFTEANVDATHRTIPLINAAENTNYAQFDIYNEAGETLYQSDLVPPDSYIEYDIYQNYETPGDYTFGMLVTYYVPTYNGDKVVGFTPCDVKINNGEITLHVVA
jgi:hypothetical protein